jgi:hypothetical protein
MCGKCLSGYTDFGQSCIECNQIRPDMICLVVLVIFALVMVLHLLAQTASGLPSIFFYFGMIF